LLQVVVDHPYRRPGPGDDGDEDLVDIRGRLVTIVMNGLEDPALRAAAVFRLADLVGDRDTFLHAAVDAGSDLRLVLGFLYAGERDAAESFAGRLKGFVPIPPSPRPPRPDPPPPASSGDLWAHGPSLPRRKLE
jgi:hypothetical protein